ncbi:PAS domain S-box protein, partial [Candidatus Pacearchaeota archaeon]|nr:PAS domain S-box protein [Candidatus Pacearchaeota archaeon]
KKAQDEREYQAHLLDNINDAVVACDEEFNWTSWNRAAEKIYGWKAHEVIGRPSAEIHQPEFIGIEAADVLRTLQETGHWRGELIHRCKDDRVVYMESNAFVLRAENDKIIGYVSVDRDITERKQMEDTLKESEEKYRDLVENTGVGIAVSDTDGKIIYVNEMHCKIQGYPYEEMIGKPFIDFIHPEDQEKIYELFIHSLEKPHEGNQLDFRVIKKNGQIVHVSSTPTVLWRDGEIAGFNAIVTDVTDRKRAEDALKESEEKFKSISEQSMMGIVIVQNGKIAYMNNAADEMFGFSKEEMRAVTIDLMNDLIHPDKKGLVLERYMRKRAGEKTVIANYPFKGITKSGDVKWFELYSSKIAYGGAPAELVTVIDITKRVQTEEALIESEEKLRAAIKGMGGAVFTQDRKLRFTWVYNPTPDFDAKDLLGKSDADFLPPNEAKLITALKKRVLKTGVSESSEYQLSIKGEPRFFEVSVDALLNLSKDIVGIVGVSKDVTERVQVYETLKESEEKFRTLAEQSPNMIFINKKGRIVYANKECERVMGYTKEELCSPDFDFLMLIASDSTDLVKETYSNHINGNEFPPYEYKIITKEGKTINAINATKLIRYEGETAILGIITDITERKLAEEELLQAQKLASIGQLAAGIAHEINTPLANISLIVSNLKKMTPGPEIEKKLGLLSEQKKIASKIVKSLLDFSRKIEPSFTNLDMNKSISEAISSVELKKPSAVNVATNLQTDLPLIKADSIQMCQVFTNIVDNAYDAMLKGGTLTVTTKQEKKGWIEIRFEDTGIGIRKKNLERIFDPFFTRKEVGEGVGLGLSISHGIIKAHKGTIRVKSKMGEGTSFTINLPVG